MCSKISKFCEEKEAFYIDDNNMPQCIQCPDNCQYCSYTMNKKIHCYFCDDNYYRDNQGVCKPCAENCSSCQGTTLDKCTRLTEGFFYNQKQKQTQKCKEEGCGHCTSSQICTSCANGYTELKHQQQQHQNQNIQKQVTCKSCDIPKCNYCNIKKDQLQKEYISCSLCQKGYFVQNEKCEKCPENCEHCQSLNGECFDCKKGFFYNKNKNTCEPKIIEHCQQMEDQEKCSSCESHYFVSEDSKSCISCTKKIQNCLYCSSKDDKDFRCHSCKDGFYYDQQQKKCIQCIENCQMCSSTTCYSCDNKFVYNDEKKQCEACQIEHCKICGNSVDDCHDCGLERFFNKETKKCEKCSKNCVGCYKSANNCQNCSVTHYTFRQEILVEQDAGQVTDFMGVLPQISNVSKLQSKEFHIKHKSIQITTKCLKKCPAKFEKHKVIQDETLKECFKIYEDTNKAKNFVKKKFHGDLHQKIEMIVEDYHKQIEQDFQNSTRDKSKHEDCSFHGNQKYVVRGVYDNYKFCVCDESHVGPICEIPRILYEQTQLNVSQILQQSSSHFHTRDAQKIQKHLFFIKKLTKIKLSLPVIEKFINIMYQISHNELNYHSKNLAFRIYDYLLCRLIEIKEQESHIDLKEREFDTLIVREKFDLEKLIKQILLLIEHTLLENNIKKSLHELLEKNENTIPQDSFNIYEYQLKNYYPEKGFQLDNPYLNDYYSKYIGSHVYFESKNTNLQFFNSNYVVQMIYFDAQLFDSLIEDQNDVLLTNVLHMSIVDPEISQQKIYPDDANIKKITIRFSLLFLPLKDDFINDVQCTAFVYDSNLHSIIGKVKNLSTVEDDIKGNEEDFLECEFDAYFPLENHYFAILLKKN